MKYIYAKKNNICEGGIFSWENLLLDINMFFHEEFYKKNKHVGCTHLQKILEKKNRTGKTTNIRRIAVREASVSRHHGGAFKAHPNTHRISEHYRIEGFNGGSLISPPLCRETRVSRTADVSFSSLNLFIYTHGEIFSKSC